MDAIDLVYDCLMEKKTLFSEYEVHTNEMLTCDPDCFEHYITERSQLAIKIDKITEEIETLCDQDQEPELLRSAMGYIGYLDDYPEEMKDVYELGGEVSGSINRIHQMEQQIQERMQTIRGELLEKIKSKTNTAKVYGYVKGVADNFQSEQNNQSSYLGDKYGKV